MERIGMYEEEEDFSEEEEYNEIEEIQKSLANLKKQLDSLDEDAAGLLIEQERLQREITPVIAALENINYKLQNLSVTRTQLLKQSYRSRTVLKTLMESGRQGGDRTIADNEENVNGMYI